MKTPVLIKDKWRGEGWEAEADLLAISDNADVSGVPRLLTVDETYPTAAPLTTTTLRRNQGLDTSGHENRVFSRFVIELHNSSISHFKSGLQFLQAFRNAIQGEGVAFRSICSNLEFTAHYDLVKAGILHRDISADNILHRR